MSPDLVGELLSDGDGHSTDLPGGVRSRFNVYRGGLIVPRYEPGAACTGPCCAPAPVRPVLRVVEPPQPPGQPPAGVPTLPGRRLSWVLTLAALIIGAYLLWIPETSALTWLAMGLVWYGVASYVRLMDSAERDRHEAEERGAVARGDL